MTSVARRNPRARGAALKAQQVTPVPGYCAYCGDPAGQLDHYVVPFSQGGTDLIYACQPCNVLLSAKWFSSFEERRTYVLARRRSRGWSPDPRPDAQVFDDWYANRLAEAGELD